MKLETLEIDGQPFLLPAESSCACHPAMPVERTPEGWECKGCGVPA